MSISTLIQQLSLPLFPDLSFNELIASKNMSGLTVKLSSRLKRSWHVKISRVTGVRLLTVPYYLESAPSSVKLSLLEWALLPLNSRKTDPATKIHRQNLERNIQSYISDLDPALYSSRLDAAKLEHKTRGNRYDLRVVFDTINNTYFQNKVIASVRWGSYSSLTSYQTVRTEKNGTRINLITIAGVYNHPDVPLFALEAVMYHEMLHIVVPPYKKNGRTIIHSPEFKNMEHKFAFYKQWHQWERDCIRNLAKSLKRNHHRNLSR